LGPSAAPQPNEATCGEKEPRRKSTWACLKRFRPGKPLEMYELKRTRRREPLPSFDVPGNFGVGAHRGRTKRRRGKKKNRYDLPRNRSGKKQGGSGGVPNPSTGHHLELGLKTSQALGVWGRTRPQGNRSQGIHYSTSSNEGGETTIC